MSLEYEFAPIIESYDLEGLGNNVTEGPVKVWGISFDRNFASGTTRNISMKSGDGSITYFTIRIILTHTPPHITIPFIADKGFKFVSESGDLLNIKVIVFHSSIGA